MFNFNDIIIGQEAIVPKYGLGRVISFNSKFPNWYIEVEPYVAKYAMKFDPKNVRLVKIGKVMSITEV